MAKIELKNIKKKFWRGVAVKDFSLEINDQEFCVLAGPSGCGKTTVLRIIAGLTNPTEGQIIIDGEDVTKYQPKNRDIAMVFQNFALYPHMKVYDNLAFGLKMRKYPKELIETRVKEAAEILDITPLLEKLPRELSGGEKQRVAVGRAIVRKPKLFLFDEPFSNLDEKLRIKMRYELKNIHNTLKTTILYVTHDQIEAMTLGEKICVMKEGTAIQAAAPMGIYSHPANLFVAGFFGFPPMNLVKVKVLKENNMLFAAGTPGSALKLKLPENIMEKAGAYEGKELVLGARAEDIILRNSYSKKIDGNTVAANVELVEPMGPESHLHINAGKNTFIMRTKQESPVKMFENIEVVFDMDKIHLFDPETELAIC